LYFSRNLSWGNLSYWLIPWEQQDCSPYLINKVYVLVTRKNGCLIIFIYLHL
jgi:hypothetical protein